jgi:hypothetical protein
MSIASGNMTYFYMQRDSLCFLTLTEESYPKRLAFLYLEEVADAILQEFLQEYGKDVSSFDCFFLLFKCCLVKRRWWLVCIMW